MIYIEDLVKTHRSLKSKLGYEVAGRIIGPEPVNMNSETTPVK